MPNRSRPEEGRSRRGFAAMDPEARRAISKRGGQASHQSGRGHEFSSEEAREAGRRGGEARWGPKRRDEVEVRPRSSSSEREEDYTRYEAPIHEEDEEEERGGRLRRPAPRPLSPVIQRPREEDEEGIERSRSRYRIEEVEPSEPPRRNDELRGSRSRTEARDEDDDRSNGGGRSRRGFASLDRDEPRDFARRGGQAAGRPRSRRERDD